mmetsp:Transcript_9970/g.19738  ORF Transcript_9970/g.19738 Transcript_9970/m.19738 type:complete len:118 (+) Transcript_9970:72-425(+)
MGCECSGGLREKRIEQVTCYLDKLRRDVARHPVLLYSTTTCQASLKAKQLLKKEAVVFEYFELDLMDCLELVVALQTLTQATKTPYVFLKGLYIGGTTELEEMLNTGEFKRICEGSK